MTEQGGRGGGREKKLVRPVKCVLKGSGGARLDREVLMIGGQRASHLQEGGEKWHRYAVRSPASIGSEEVP